MTVEQGKTTNEINLIQYPVGSLGDYLKSKCEMITFTGLLLEYGLLKCVIVTVYKQSMSNFECINYMLGKKLWRFAKAFSETTLSAEEFIEHARTFSTSKGSACELKESLNE